MKMMTRLAFSLLTATAFSVAAADTLTLVDGRSYEGTVVSKENVYTLTAGERLFQFRKTDVQALNGEVITPVVRIATGKGDMLAALYEDQAPNTVASLISLAEKGFFEGMAFHRIIPGFMAQGGCPNSKLGADGVPGTGDPGYKFADEIAPELKHTGKGILSMANSGPNTNGSQFFICFKETPHLDGKHAVFGRIVKGLEVLDQLESLGSESGTPSERVPFTIEVVAKRNHEYAVKPL